jgi:hypothetical protein
MSEFIDTYASTPGTGGTSFVPGLNSGVKLTHISYVKEENYNYVQLTFEKNGSEIRDRIYEATRFEIREKKKRENGVLVPDGIETEAEAAMRVWGEINSKFKSLIVAFCGDEAYEVTRTKTQPRSFEALVNMGIGLLPRNYAEIEGDLIVGFNKKGYLTVPIALWVTGDFFSTSENPRDLKVSKRVILEREDDKPSEPAEQVAPVQWATPVQP